MEQKQKHLYKRFFPFPPNLLILQEIPSRYTYMYKYILQESLVGTYHLLLCRYYTYRSCYSEHRLSHLATLLAPFKQTSSFYFPRPHPTVSGTMT